MSQRPLFGDDDPPAETFPGKESPWSDGSSARVGFGPFRARPWSGVPSWHLRQIGAGFSPAAQRARNELHRRAELTKHMTDAQRDEHVRRWENQWGYRRK
jgi:hypothetical protein